MCIKVTVQVPEFTLFYCHVIFLYKIHSTSVSLWSSFCPKHILVCLKKSPLWIFCTLINFHGILIVVAQWNFIEMDREYDGIH